MMVAYFSNSRKSGLLRCPSRWGSPVLRVETSRVASMEERDASVVCSVRSPVMPLMVPFTFAIIMCLTLNSATVWAGSIFHVMREAGAEMDAMGGSFRLLGCGRDIRCRNILLAGSCVVRAASIGQPELVRNHPTTMPAGGSLLFLDFLAGFRFRQSCMSKACTFPDGWSATLPLRTRTANDG